MNTIVIITATQAGTTVAGTVDANGNITPVAYPTPADAALAAITLNENQYLSMPVIIDGSNFVKLLPVEEKKNGT